MTNRLAQLLRRIDAAREEAERPPRDGVNPRQEFARAAARIISDALTDEPKEKGHE